MDFHRFDIRCLHASELTKAYEIIHDGSVEEWVDARRKYPSLTTGALLDGVPAGVCYGEPFPSSQTEVVLSGIAVEDHLKGRGLGSRLLSYFEGQVQREGYVAISLGSARGHVDHFYLKNGYSPVEFAFWVSLDYQLSAELQARYGIRVEQRDPGERRLSVRITELDEGLRDRLLADFPVDAVTSIMYKRIG